MKDLTGLRMIAEHATPGPWELVAFDSGHSAYTDDCAVTVAENGDIIVDMDALSRQGNEMYAKDDGLFDATFIATFDPPTVLELIDELETARRQRNEALVQVDKITQAWSSVVEYAEGLERRLSDAGWEANMDRQGGA